MRDFLGDDVGAGSAELCSIALLGGGPNHVAVLINQAHCGERFVLALLAVLEDSFSPAPSVFDLLWPFPGLSGLGPVR